MGQREEQDASALGLFHFLLALLLMLLLMWGWLASSTPAVRMRWRRVGSNGW